MHAELGLSIIVVNYASSALLRQNLAQMSDAVPEAAVFVVDNRTTDAERGRVQELADLHGWTVLAQTENLGFGGGVNRGVEAARAQGRTRHLLVNPDATIDAASIRRMLEAVAGDVPAIAAPVVADGAGRPWSAGHVLDLADGATHGRRWAEAHPDATIRPWLTAAVLLVNDAAWEATGGFDEDYFLYWEDVDFSLRVTAAGGRLILVDDATAVHDEGGTQGIGDPDIQAKSPIYYYYNIRNRMLLAKKLLDAETVRRWERTSMQAAREIILRGGKRQLLRPWRPVRAAWRGWRDGRRIARSAGEFEG